MTRIFILICLVMTSITAYGKSYPHGGYLADQIFNRSLGEELIPKFHYGVYGYGGSSTRDFVRLVSASIYCPGDLSREELEDVFVETIEALLRAYNSNRRIRPLLVDYPLTLENLEICISAAGAYLEHPKARTRIAYVPHPPYKLIYHYYDPVTNTRDRTEIGELGTYAELKARREAARGRPFLED